MLTTEGSSGAIELRGFQNGPEDNLGKLVRDRHGLVGFEVDGKCGI
jgi:hypothetical protein